MVVIPQACLSVPCGDRFFWVFLLLFGVVGGGGVYALDLSKHKKYVR